MAYHTLTWLAWLCAAAYLALVNGQPLQTLLLMLATGTVFTLASRRHTGTPSRHPSGGEGAVSPPSGQDGQIPSKREGVPRVGAESRQVEGWSTFLRFGLWVWVVATIFNLFFAHAGNIVLFVLPRNWPLVGGPITLEGLLYGLAHGASLFAVLLVFATLNLGLDVNRLLRWLPAGLFQAGLIVSIALSFVPQMMASLRDVREAQLVRGHKFRGLRDLPPLFIPLITTALERSLTLAESMEARGFGGIAQVTDTPDPSGTPSRHLSGGAGTPSPQRWRDFASRCGVRQSRVAGRHLLTTVATLISLVGLLSGLLWRAADVQPAWPGVVFLTLSVLLLVAALYLQGRGFKRTHYRLEVWHARDTWVSLACLASIVIVAYTQVRNTLALFYYPYPPFSPWPTFAPSLGVAILLIAAPSLLWPAPEAATAPLGLRPPGRTASRRLLGEAHPAPENPSNTVSQHGRYSPVGSSPPGANGVPLEREKDKL